MTLKILDVSHNIGTKVTTVTFSVDDQPGSVIGYNADNTENFDTLILAELSDTTVAQDYYFDGTTIHPTPAKPTVWSEWNWNTNTWSDPRTLADVKAAKWLVIRDKRNQVEYGGFSWDNNVFDSDPTSQQRIMGAVQLAALDPEFVVDWTLKNNATIELTAQDLKDLATALAQHVTQTHQHARLLREQINVATQNSQVDAINW
jgi:hypothetical protein